MAGREGTHAQRAPSGTGYPLGVVPANQAGYPLGVAPPGSPKPAAGYLGAAAPASGYPPAEGMPLPIQCQWQ